MWGNHGNINQLDHINWHRNCANLCRFSRQTQDVAVPKETYKFSERSLIAFTDSPEKMFRAGVF